MDKLTFYFFVFSVFCGKDVLCKRREHNQKQGGKIVGGHAVDNIQSYPYMASLLLGSYNETIEDDTYTMCSGFIASRDFIITAAHCLIGVRGIDVRIGSTQSDSGGDHYDSYTGLYKIHPQYNAATREYDVALVTTDRRMTLDGKNTRAIRLVDAGLHEPGFEVPDGSKLIVPGWGTTEDGETTTLHVATVTSISRDKCRELYGNKTITDKMFCAGPGEEDEGPKGPCTGDSGAPAVINGDVVGLVSQPAGCGRADQPAVYTRIGDYEIEVWLINGGGW